jgi:hypothetical protein
MEKKGTRFKCWQCGTPYESDLRNHLPEETIRAIMNGRAKRQRYLKFCKICNPAWYPEEMVEVPNFRDMRWKSLCARHLHMMDHQCQVCGLLDRDDVRVCESIKNPLGRRLQRNCLALCTECYSVVEHRLGINSPKRGVGNELA